MPDAYVETPATSWPLAAMSGMGGWLCPGISGITYTRTLSYKRVRTVYPEDNADWSLCNGKAPVVEYQEWSGTKTISGHETVSVSLESGFYTRGAKQFPISLSNASPTWYPSIGRYHIDAGGDVSEPFSTSWGSASCKWDAGQQAWVFGLDEGSGSGDTYLPNDHDIINLWVYRRWFHAEWGFIFTHERLDDTDNNYGIAGQVRAWLGGGNTRTFVLTAPPPPDGWTWESYSESITVTLDTV